MAQVKAPNRGYNGPGPGGVVFENGVAETDDESALNYFRGAGYEVDGETDNPVALLEPPDPRKVTLEQIGTKLRDAAVNPQPGDYLPPTNAGQDNPHGSTVVSPEIHASGPAGITAGVVFVEDPAKQEERETERARARLVRDDTLAETIAAEVPDLDDRGELDLSDPGSADAGRTGTGTEPTSEPAPTPETPGDPTGEPAAETEVKAPSKADPKADWVDYAVTQGADRDEAEAATKADLVDTYSK